MPSDPTCCAFQVHKDFISPLAVYWCGNVIRLFKFNVNFSQGQNSFSIVPCILFSLRYKNLSKPMWCRRHYFLCPLFHSLCHKLRFALNHNQLLLMRITDSQCHLLTGFITFLNLFRFPVIFKFNVYFPKMYACIVHCLHLFLLLTNKYCSLVICLIKLGFIV